MIRDRKSRRILGAILVVLGGVLMWAPVSFVGGIVLIAAGLALEAVGFWLERH